MGDFVFEKPDKGILAMLKGHFVFEKLDKETFYPSAQTVLSLKSSIKDISLST